METVKKSQAKKNDMRQNEKQDNEERDKKKKQTRKPRKAFSTGGKIEEVRLWDKGRDQVVRR